MDTKANFDVRMKDHERIMRRPDMLTRGDTLDYTVINSIHKILQEPPKLDLVDSVDEKDVKDIN